MAAHSDFNNKYKAENMARASYRQSTEAVARARPRTSNKDKLPTILAEAGAVPKKDGAVPLLAFATKGVVIGENKFVRSCRETIQNEQNKCSQKTYEASSGTTSPRRRRDILDFKDEGT
jgi:hypothetical protein